MSREPQNRRRMRRSTVAGIVAACIVLAVLAGAVWWQRGQAFWTDGRTTRVAVGAINVRDVLWTRPARVELPAGKEDAQTDQAYEPSLSPDGTELYFVRGKPGTGSRIFVSHRRGLAWSEPVAVDAINGKFDVLGPRVTADGKYLLFSSNRPGGIGGYDIWAAPRVEGKSGSTWGQSFNLGPGVNSEFNEYNPDPTPDGLHLIFSTNRKAAGREQVQAWQGTIRQSATADYDLWMATLESAVPPTTAPSTQPSTQPARSLAFRDAAEIPNVNTPFTEGASCMSPAGDFLYFASNRPGGYGKFDIYRSRIVRGEFLAPENLGPSVNSDDNDADPALGLDGFRLYFSSDRGNQRGSYELFSSDSREVFTERLARPLPRIGWSLGSLLLSAAILIPLILLLHGTRNRKLSVLQRCMILSLIVHAGAAFLFSFVIVTQEVRRYARQGGGGTVNLNLGTPADVAVGFAVRGQFSVDRDAVNAAIAAEAALPAQGRVAREEVAVTPLDIATPALPNNARGPAAAASVVADPVRTSRAIQTSGAPKDAMNGLFDPGIAIADPGASLNVTPTGTTGQVTQAETKVEPAAAARVTATKVAMADPPGQRGPAERVASPGMPSAARPAESGLAGPAGNGSRPLLLSTSGGATVAGFSEPRVGPVNAAPVAAISAAAKRVGGSEARPDDAAAAAIDRLPMGTTRPAGIGVERAANGDALVLPPPAAGPASRPVAQALATIAVARGAATRPTSALASSVTPETLGISQPAPGAIAPQVAIAPAAVRAVRTQAREDAAPAPGPVADAAHSEKLATAATGSAAPADHIVNDLTPLPKATAVPASGPDAEGPTLATATYRPTAPDHPIPPPDASLTPITPAGSLGPGPIAAGESPFPRSKPQREANLKKRGGNDESEAAVIRGLSYLAQAQQPDGRWTHMLDGENPTHRENTFPHDSACTGLALLAMLAHDNTPDAEGPYRDAVKRGLEFLLSIQPENGDLRGRPELRGGGPSRADMYDHAIAAFAMGEAALMSRDKRYTDAAVKGARFIVASQDPRSGGWRYTPREYGDSSVFGWQIMALHTAEQLGFQIPDETRHAAAHYLQLCAQPGHRTLAGYQPGHGPTAAMTAELLYSRMLLGERLDQDDLADAVGFLISQPADPNNPDLYCCYYGSLCLVQTQGDAWKQWNQRVRDALIRLQQRDGPLAGSWDTDLRWGNQGGRVFTTSLAVLTLEVYYRYLPLQPKGND